ncbi:MAG TPA: YfiR family protein [Bryobacteraceae bacterium]|nr:YfiR family protein [Bryobacteraceae bacterium]
MAALRLCAPAFMVLPSLLLPGLAAEPQPALEYQVRAAFLLNFTRFIEWPPPAEADPASSIAICIVGDDPFGAALDQIVAGETLQGRKLTVRRVRRPVPSSCQVAYISRVEKGVDNLLASIPPGILTVSEGDGFLRDGGMIAFVLENHRVRFDINQSSAMKAGVRINSKLLNVARSVEK